MKLCRLFGHRFRPRYHERWSGPDWLVAAIKDPNPVKINHSGEIEQDHTKTYLYDVCVRCGIRTEEG